MRLLILGAHLLRDDVEPVAVALPAKDLFLSALEIAEDQPLGDRELLVRAAALRARLLERATFVAIRYGFTATSAEDAQSKCATHLDRWRSLAELHREHVEMTLKVAAASPLPRPDRRDFSNGAAYLRALHAAKQGAAADPAFRDAVGELLAPLAVRHRWIQRDEKSLEFAALVAQSSVDAVREAGESLRARMPDTPFLLSGPWPLEVFADADRE